MPLDAVCLSAVVRELEPVAVGARVDKIYQPARDEVILALRGREGTAKLLLTANPAHPRLQLTKAFRDNPATPPMFCMLLRKHLSGGRILSITQPSMERVVDIELETLDELGIRAPRHLILEAMGRRANLILTDADGRIVDCLRRVDAEMSAERPVLPGMFYRLPPTQEKQNPLDLTEENFSALLAQANPEQKIADVLLDRFAGLSPLICREIAYALAGDVDARLFQVEQSELIGAFLRRMECIRQGQFTPYVLLRDDQPKDFTYCPIHQYGDSMTLKQADSFSAMLDSFYAERENAERIRQRGADLIKSVTNLRNRAARKLENQRRELAQAEDREALRIRGELITANLYAMQKGMKSLTCDNYYDPDGGQITIQLDPLLTPQQNAASFYKRYTKAKTAEKMLTEQIAKGETDLDYLDSVLTCIRCSEEERDLIEIRQELEDNGYLRAKKAAKKGMKRAKSKPMEFRSTTGMRISVGRNNVQNDQLTTKQAFKSDIWLHTQGIHGAHVILWTEGQEADAQSLTEAAMLAAWFSQGKEGKNVPVDYTPVRYVKKPSGAKPGMVTYTTYSTAYVTPDRELAEKLRIR
jgi:predicted ribosome quality control (RQC) complex YloA/Tae2 family protein